MAAAQRDNGSTHRTPALQEIDGKLEAQLKAWEEITSPYSDTYDVGKIYDAGHELRRTVEGALEMVKPSDKEVPGDPQQEAVMAFNLMLSSALAGISEQVGSRLIALSSGKTAEMATMSNQTKELVTRAEKDPVVDEIATEAKAADDVRKEFRQNAYTAESVGKMRIRLLEIRARLLDATVAPQQAQQLRAELEDVAKALDLFNTAMGKVEMPATVQKTFKAAGQEFSSVLRKLTGKKLSADQISELVSEGKAFVSTITGFEEKFLTKAEEIVTNNAEEFQGRLDRYKQFFEDARTRASKNPSGYWGKVKNNCLDQVGAVAGNDTKKVVDAAFDAGFSDQLAAWSGEIRKTKLDATRLQESALKIFGTIDSYSRRAEHLLAKEASNTALVEIHDGLQSSLAAIREAVTLNLTSLRQRCIWRRHLRQRSPASTLFRNEGHLP